MSTGTGNGSWRGAASHSVARRHKLPNAFYVPNEARVAYGIAFRSEPSF